MKDYNRAYQLLVQLYDIIKVEGKGRVDYYINEVLRIIATGLHVCLPVCVCAHTH